MPEGPEVRRIVDQLNPKVANRLLRGIEIVSGRYLKHGLPDGLSDFALHLPMKILDTGCKGKFIYYRMVDPDNVIRWTIWNTLGMTGGWSPESGDYTRLKFQLDFGAIFFNDARNFGTIKFVSGGEEPLKKKLSTLGPDVLQEDLDDLEFFTLVQAHPKKTLPQFLMNQQIISGVGNYIKSESLYLARLSPHRTCDSLTEEEISRLNSAVKAIIRDSYASGGSTFRTYRDFDGNVGNYSERFMVYNRKTDPEGRPILKEETKDRRRTFWVPSIQG